MPSLILLWANSEDGQLAGGLLSSLRESYCVGPHFRWWQCGSVLVELWL